MEVKKYLTDRRIEFKEFEHEAVFTVGESKNLKSKIPGLHCKTLFLKDSNGKFYLVGMPALKRLDILVLRKKIGVRKLHFASEEELFDLLRFRPGSVSIFGMINCSSENVKLILDREVWDASAVGFHPNLNTSTLVLTHLALEKYFESLDCEKEVVELDGT
jgi:Ala-tRNA(Pro) deacylase